MRWRSSVNLWGYGEGRLTLLAVFGPLANFQQKREKKTTLLYGGGEQMPSLWPLGLMQ